MKKYIFILVGLCYAFFSAMATQPEHPEFPELKKSDANIIGYDGTTGALDFNTGAAILKLLQDICKNYNKNVIVITHNQAITPMADKVITMRSGRVQDIVVNPVPVPIEQITW